MKKITLTIIFVLSVFLCILDVKADYYFESDIIGSTDAIWLSDKPGDVHRYIYTSNNGNTDYKYHLFCLQQNVDFSGGKYQRYDQIIQGPACSAAKILNDEIKKEFMDGSRLTYLINPGEENYKKIQKELWNNISSDNTTCEIKIFGFEKEKETLTLIGDSYTATIDLTVDTSNQIDSDSIESKYKNYITIDTTNNKLIVNIPKNELLDNENEFDIKIETDNGYYIVPKIDKYKPLNNAGQEIGIFYFAKEEYWADSKITINVPGNGTCETELSQSDHSKSSLINLWKTYKYRGLLNFSNPTCDNNIIYNNSTSCFSANHINSDFTENNVSQYSEVENPNGNPIFCSTSFILKNTLRDMIPSVKSGMLLYKGIDDKIMTGSLEKICYLYTNNDQVSFTSPSNLYDDNIEYVKIGDINLNPTSNVRNNGVIKELGNGVYQYIYTIDLAYNLPTYNAMHGSGKIISDENLCKVVDGSKTYTKCENIGSGIVTNLSSDETSTIPFSYRYNQKDYIADCPFVSEPGICDPKKENCKLNLDFRIIDVSKPFSGKTGNNRTVGDNWCEKTDDDLIKTCSGDPSKNKVISEYITNKNNSYNKTNEGAKYIIELTPETIKQIRKYNKKTPYDDINLKCENDICISNYLTKLKDDGLLTINNSKNREIIKK